jgi:ABC-type uncharacterized transport system auxiliary subunit
MAIGRYRGAFILCMLLTAAGCINVNVRLGDELTGDVTFWELDYPRPQSTALKFERVIRVRDFSSSGVYELPSMVLRLANGSVVESALNRWSSRPTALLPVLLARDLVAEETYTAVFLQTSTVTDRLVIDGYVREFGAVEVDSSTWMVVFDVDVTLLGDRSTEVIFQNNYRFEHRMDVVGYSMLAEELSVLTEIWSEQVRGDLASALLPRR